MRALIQIISACVRFCGRAVDNLRVLWYNTYLRKLRVLINGERSVRMSIIDRNDEKDDFWDLDKLMPKKKSATLSPFVTKPTVSDYSAGVPAGDVKDTAEPEKRAEERKLTLAKPTFEGTAESVVYYPENSLIKSITVKKFKEKYDFYDSFRKAAILYFDCPGEKCEFAQFYSYMPQYSQLNKAQKSYYFYWRSEMRQGRFIKTDYSYLYLYVYEIINLPDIIEPKQGIKLLCRLWKEYRKALPRMDMYFSIWLRDYCLVHALECPIREIQDFIFDVIRISDFKEFYFVDLGTTSREGVWSIIAYLSDYDWLKGFRTVTGKESDDAEYRHRADTYKTLFEGAMRVILPSVWKASMKEKEGGNLKTLAYSAFQNTLCTHSVKCKLEIEYYPLADASQLRSDITSAVRYTENKLRALYGAKSRLAVKNIPTEYKELIDCYFDSIIRKSEASAKRRSAPEYEKLYDAPREKLSFAGADEIERLSWDTTMRLCDTDEYVDETVTHGITEAEQIDERATDATASKTAPETLPEPEGDRSDTYGLSRADIEYISALLTSSERGVDGIDEEAIVERINEAFSDGFGDVIIEDNGDGFAIIEDYQEDITEWLKNI